MIEFLDQIVEKVVQLLLNFSGRSLTRTDKWWVRTLTVSRPNVAATRAALIHVSSPALGNSMEEVDEVDTDCATNSANEC